MNNVNKISLPPVRNNLPCGFDKNNIASGREPCQMGWYSFIGNLIPPENSLLDVGAGMCEGVKLLRHIGFDVTAQDIDEQLKKVLPDIWITPLEQIPSKRFDSILCLDVIEHVIEDLAFFDELKRIAKKQIFITTPNYSRSKAQNHCHCREYTIPQFCNIFSPTEIWSGSPDGCVHHTKLLSLTECKTFYKDETKEGVYYRNRHLPDSISFTHSTVDGEEWPHIFAIFKV